MRTSSDGVGDTRARARAHLVATSPCTPADQVADTAGAIVIDVDGTPLVPTFQLDERGRAYATVADVNARLTAAGLDAWAAWAWWTGWRATIDSAPVDLLDVDHTALHDAVGRLMDPQG